MMDKKKEEKKRKRGVLGALKIFIGEYLIRCMRKEEGEEMF